MEKWNRAVAVPLVVWLLLTGLGRFAAAQPAPIEPTAAPVASASASPARATNGTPATAVVSPSASNTGAAATTSSAEELSLRYNAEALRSYLRLQEQMHTALLAIGQARAEASAEAQTNVQAMIGRLESMERDLADKRAEDALAARNSNRLMMAAAAGMFLVGILAMVLTAVIQARGMNRLAEIALGLGPARGLPGLHSGSGPTGSLALPSGDRLLLGGGADSIGASASHENGRLQSMIHHLEGRIREMEAVARPGPDDKAGLGLDLASAAPAATLSKGSSSANPRAVTLAKAQTLLNLGQPQAALGAVEEAISREPNDAELHLRKGMALERLKRFEQAIEAYDRAIALDTRCTQAYLSKGGILNQQSRYQEALACYEQALENRTRSA